jgi:hypothetical protein
MTAELKEKTHYPSDVVAVLDAMAIGDLELLGSATLRSQQYAGDYDGHDVVKVKSAAEAAEKFRAMILRLDKLPDLWITEIKAGVKDGEKVVWTVESIRDHLKDLAAAIPTGLVKVDAVAVVGGNRLAEFNIIYDFGYEADRSSKEILQELEEDREDYRKEGNWIKVLKRDFAIAKFIGKTSEVKRLTEVLNSEIGKLYQMVTDLDVLLTLLEQGESIPSDLLAREVDTLISRLGSIYKLGEVLHSETSLVKLLQSSISVRNLTEKVSRLRKVRNKLESILQKKAREEVA